MTRPKSGRLRNLALLAVSVLLSLLVLEIVLRFVSPPLRIGVGSDRTPKAELFGWAPPPSEELPFVDPDTGRVSYFTTNAEGWKDVAHTFDKPAGTVRILFLGDSLTYGFVPFEDLYTRHVERLLHRRGFDHVEVITIGVGGWGTDQALEALLLEGRHYEPDLVIYQFTGNDVSDNRAPDAFSLPLQDLKPFRYELRGGEPVKVALDVEREPVSFTRRCRRFLLRRSALAYNLALLRARLSGSTDATPTVKRIDPASKIERTNRYEARNRAHWWDDLPVNPDAPPYYIYSTDERSAELQQAWELFEALLVRMKEVAEQAGARLVVFSQDGDPAHLRWETDLNRILHDGTSHYVVWNGEKRGIDWMRSLRDLETITTRHGIPLIKPVREYERYRYDPHPNAAGNRSMAEDIVDFLLARELLEPKD